MAMDAETDMATRMDDILSSILLVLIQAAVAVVGSYFTYTHEISAASYGYFRDVSIMIFFGFGFLMTFLHRHGLSAIGYCLVISALVCEMSVGVEHIVNKGSSVLTIENMMNALFCSGAVMISYGAVIGKVTPLQLIIMAIVEVFGFWLNIRLCVTENGAHDVGGGMVIHTFGAYFGLAATFFVSKKAAVEASQYEKSVYSSDLFSLAGTIFLWVLWPSFQSAVAGPESRQFLAMTNTFFSLCSSTIAFAAISRVLNKHKFDVVHLQNATLAGGVAMGVAGDMDMGMHGAMVAGFAAGALSCVGYTIIMPNLVKLGIHDTCGVNNLHGMPGILSAIVGIIVTAMHGETAGEHNTKGFEDVTWNKQLYALLITLGLGIGFGAVAGILMNYPLALLKIKVPDTELFNDSLFFVDADSSDNGTEVNTISVLPNAKVSPE